MHRESDGEAAFEALDRGLRRHPGHRLFTVLLIDWDRFENRRIYTSDPVTYPCGGAKPLRPESEFFRQLVVHGQARVCPDRESCRLAFPDYRLIESLGCGSAINVPIRRDGRTVGSLNLLHEAGWYREEMIAALGRSAGVAAELLIEYSPGERP